MKTDRAESRRGFALLAALWLVMAIAAVALEFGLQAHDRSVTAINVAERMQAAAAANAGIETTRSRLDRLMEGKSGGDRFVAGIDTADPWAQAPYLLSGGARVGNAAFAVTVRDAGDLLNVNLLGEDEWRAFLASLGEDYDTADRIAQAITDWRDHDDDPRPRGAERAQYARLGRLVLPANRNFASVADLRDVVGVTPELYARIAPYLSVGTDGTVNVNTADAAVLRTLPGFTDDVVSAVLEQRSGDTPLRSMQQLLRSLPTETRSALVKHLNELSGRAAFRTQAVLVHSVGWAPGRHIRVVSDALLVRGRNEGQRETIHQWRRDE